MKSADDFDAIDFRTDWPDGLNRSEDCVGFVEDAGDRTFFKCVFLTEKGTERWWAFEKMGESEWDDYDYGPEFYPPVRDMLKAAADGILHE